MKFLKNWRGTKNGEAGGAQTEAHVKLSSDDGGIRKLSGDLDVFGEQCDLSKKLLFQLQIALDEITSNIVKYGYQDREPWQLDLTFRVRGRDLEIEILDDAPPFDPRNTKPPEIGRTLRETQVGGLGVHIVRELMDDMEYQRHDDKNHLILRKKIEDG